MTARILPERLRELYRTHGVVPDRGIFLVRSGRDPSVILACGLGITYYDSLDDASLVTCGGTVYPRTIRCELNEMSYAYKRGYAHGFSGLPSTLRYDLDPCDYDLGYADGQAGWLAVKDFAVAE